MLTIVMQGDVLVTKLCIQQSAAFASASHTARNRGWYGLVLFSHLDHSLSKGKAHFD